MMRPGSNVLKISEGLRLEAQFVYKLSNPEDGSAQFTDYSSRPQEVVIYGKSDFYKESDTEGIQTKRFKVAFADFLNAPFVDVIDLTSFTGNIGSIIGISMAADFLAKTIFVKIETGDGITVSEGFANPGLLSSEWTFFLNQNHPKRIGDKITITASPK